MPDPHDLLFPARAPDLGVLIAELSELATGPHADNLISNEDSYPRVAGMLARQAPRGGVYLGVGPDQNFTYIARVGPGLAFIVDYRRRNLLLHLVHKALFALSAERVAYLTRLTARRPGKLPADPGAGALVDGFDGVAMDQELLGRTIDEVAEYLRPFGVVADDEWAALATIQAKLAGPGMNARFLALPMYPTFGQLIRTIDREGSPAHLLAREDFYHAVRELQRGDRVVPLVGDLAGAKALPGLGAWLRRHRLAVSVAYVSDVEFFLFRSGRFAAFTENLANLPWAGGALIVRTSTREIDHPARVRGDSATTVARPVAPFLEAALAHQFGRFEDLFGR